MSGAAAVASSLSPEEASLLHRELAAARELFVLDDDLHSIYMVIHAFKG